jgi:hypothetical protein
MITKVQTHMPPPWSVSFPIPISFCRCFPASTIKPTKRIHGAESWRKFDSWLASSSGLEPGLILRVQKVHADRVQTQLGVLMFV